MKQEVDLPAVFKAESLASAKSVQNIHQPLPASGSVNQPVIASGSNDQPAKVKKEFETSKDEPQPSSSSVVLPTKKE